MAQLCFLLIFAFSALFGSSKLPELKSEDVSAMLEEILEAHATHKHLSPLLVDRCLHEYVEILDPLKTYFLENEVSSLLTLSESELKRLVGDFEKGNFTLFEDILTLFAKAVKRREVMEKRILSLPLPAEVHLKEFKEIAWVQSEGELQERLSRLRALQLRAAEKFDAQTQEGVFKRIDKRRRAREEEFTTHDPEQKKKLALTYALKAFASSFDGHTSYFTPFEASSFLIQIQQRLFGIGVQLRDDLSGFTIVKIIPGSPASKSTLRPNDRLIAIENEPIVGMEIVDVVELIRGEEGTKVALTVLRENKEKQEERCDIEVTRGEVVIEEARLESKLSPFGDGVIAHLALHAFYQDATRSSASDLYEAIAKIKRDHKLKGVILDLRNNSGGVLPQAVAVSGLFITKGIIVAIKDHLGHVEFLREAGGHMIWEGPLLVLTSKHSASAAEIVAQALQDYGRAILVGDNHTYGKGTFQTFTLDANGNGKVNPKGEFKVTRGRYYTVSGKSPQLVGVVPDIEIPGLFSALEIGEQHGKYPLDNDVIDENFRDDLSDIEAGKREELSWLYRFNLQPKIKTYLRHLPILQQNCAQRMSNDKFYEHFLTALKNDADEEISPSLFEVYRLSDPQLKESMNVLKDLITLAN